MLIGMDMVYGLGNSHKESSTSATIAPRAKFHWHSPSSINGHTMLHKCNIRTTTAGTDPKTRWRCGQNGTIQKHPPDDGHAQKLHQCQSWHENKKKKPNRKQWKG